ncbi:MAG: DUF4412 domain-containing protein [Bacteroidia bacterium]
MKKHFGLFLLQLLFIVPFAFAQNFEGSIEYSLSVDGEGENIQQTKDAMPNKMTYFIKDDNMKIRTEGGMAAAMAGDIIMVGKERTMYILQPASKMAMQIKMEDTEDEEVKPVVTKMDETENIAGYDCQKYKVVSKTEQGDVVSYLWVTDKLKVDVPQSMMQSGTQMNLPGEIDGFPLKVISHIDMAGNQLTMIFTASEVNKTSLNASDFKIPEDYTKQVVSPDMLGR